MNYPLWKKIFWIGTVQARRLTIITLKNIPEGSKLFGADKQEVLANSDGTYTLKVDENGKVRMIPKPNYNVKIDTYPGEDHYSVTRKQKV